MAFNLKNIFQRPKPEPNAPEVHPSEPPENPSPPSPEESGRSIIDSQPESLEKMSDREPTGSSVSSGPPLLDTPDYENENLASKEASLAGASPPQELPVGEKDAQSFKETVPFEENIYREEIEKGNEKRQSPPPEIPREVEEKKEPIEETGSYESDQVKEKEPVSEIPGFQDEGRISPVPTLAIEDEGGPDLFRPEKNTAKLVRFGIIGLVTFLILAGGAFAGVWLFRSFLATPPLPEKEISLPPPAETPAIPTELTLAERDSKRIDDLDGLTAALSRYHNAFNSYPSTNGSLEKVFKDTAADSFLSRELVLSYVSEVPSDPNATFYYGYSSDGSSYELTSLLENQDHAECLVSGDYCVRTIRNGEVVSRK